MNNLVYEYNAGLYTVKFEGTYPQIIDEMDRLLDFYRNELEEYSFDDPVDQYKEKLEMEGFHVEETYE